MKRIVRCCKCLAESTPSKWVRDGWIKVETTYSDGNKWRDYTCAACRNKPDAPITKPFDPTPL